MLDLFVKLPPNIGLDMLRAAGEAVKGDYPLFTRHLLHEHRIRLMEGKSEVSSAEPTSDGWLFRSSNGQQVFQARLDGFSFNRLKPYEGWARFRDEARQLWNAYAAHAMPEFVTKVALRFINQIELTLPVQDFGQYLSSMVPTPGGFSTVCGFLTRVSVPDPGSPATATVTQLFDPGPGESKAKMILDIETASSPRAPMSPDEAWSVLESLRDLKNRCFFGSVTDKAIEAFA